MLRYQSLPKFGDSDSNLPICRIVFPDGYSFRQGFRLDRSIRPKQCPNETQMF
jgi:hypothetical protein